MEIIPPAVKEELKWLSEMLYNLKFHKNRLTQRWGKGNFYDIEDAVVARLSEVLDDIDSFLEELPADQIAEYRKQLQITRTQHTDAS